MAELLQAIAERGLDDGIPKFLISRTNPDVGRLALIMGSWPSVNSMEHRKLKTANQDHARNYGTERHLQHVTLRSVRAPDGFARFHPSAS